MRIHGVDNIKPAAARKPCRRQRQDPDDAADPHPHRQAGARRRAACWKPSPGRSFRPSRQSCSAAAPTALKLANPIAADMSDMRPSLLPGLLSRRAAQCRQGLSATSRSSKSPAPMRTTAPEGQRRVAGGVRRGTASLDGAGRSWSNAAKGGGKPVDVFDAKADALAVHRSLRPADDQYPDRAGRSRLVSSRPLRHDQDGPEDRARLLRRIPSEDAGSARCLRRALRLRGLSSTPCPSRRRRRPAPSRRWSFPPSRRSSATSPSSSTRAWKPARIMRAASGADRKLITGVNVFDIFEGASLGEGKKSIAIEVSDPAGRAHADRRGFRGADPEDRRQCCKVHRRRA